MTNLIYQLQNDRDIIGRRWAMGELAQVASGDDVSDSDKSKIVAAITNSLANDKSYRIKRAAIEELGSVLIQKNQAGLPTGTINYDEATTAALIKTAKDENAPTRGDAIEFLGYSADAKHAPLYISALNDRSYYVIDKAAAALQKRKTNAPLML